MRIPLINILAPQHLICCSALVLIAPLAVANESGPVTLKGKATNVTGGKSASVRMTIAKAASGDYQAKGQYDCKNLFGKFDVPGKMTESRPGIGCYQFSGKLGLGGNDGSGLAEGTEADYAMSLYCKGNKVTGVYCIPHFRDYSDQYGTLTLTAHGKMPGMPSHKK